MCSGEAPSPAPAARRPRRRRSRTVPRAGRSARPTRDRPRRRRAAARAAAASTPARGSAQRGPGLFLEDVDDLVAALAGRRAEDHRELRGLVAERERPVDDVLVDVDGVAGPELLPFLLEPLLDAPLAHPDDLLLVGMAVEGVAGARLERDVHDAQRARPGELGAADPPGHAPVELVAHDVPAGDEPAAAHCALSWIGMDLKRLMFSVMATSVGRRSMLEAPKKPTMPVVRSSTYCASSGSAIGPPWHRQRMSGLTSRAASPSACTRSTASSSVTPVWAPIAPPVVSPMCGTSTSAPASAIIRASSGVKTYGAVRRSSSLAARIISTSSAYPIPVSSRPCR